MKRENKKALSGDAEQKAKFNKAKEKQMDKDPDQFEENSDKDTTGKSEVFSKKQLGVRKPATNK